MALRKDALLWSQESRSLSGRHRDCGLERALPKHNAPHGASLKHRPG